MPRLSKADALGTLIEKCLSSDINLSPNPVMNGDGSVKHPGLDNHAMGTIFEEFARESATAPPLTKLLDKARMSF